MKVYMLELKPMSGPIDLICIATSPDLAKREAFNRAPRLASAQWHSVQGLEGAEWCQVPGRDRLVITPINLVTE